jgi:type IV pilus assembly protein PilA
MKTVRVLSQKGFSLVELMVVVAIIAILSAIAVPNFQRYQQKARQSEAKNNLAAYYSANKASMAEFGAYASNFVAIGFRPEGTLKYRIMGSDGFGGTASWAQPPKPNAPTCITTNMVCNFASTGTQNSTWAEDIRFSSVPAGCTAQSPSGTTFTACASSNIAQTGTSDTWQIDQGKNLTNPTSGLN